MKCFDLIKKNGESCKNVKCRCWINYKNDLNCVLVAVDKHGAMKFEDIGNRINLTAARIKQIETQILEKIRKNPEMRCILE